MSLHALLLAFSLAQAPPPDAPAPDSPAPEALATEMTAPQAPQHDAHAGGVPAFLPRAVFFGASSALGLITPQLRLDWELVLIQARHDVFMIYLEGGGGYGLSLPKGFGNAGTDAMTFFYEHT